MIKFNSTFIHAFAGGQLVRVRGLSQPEITLDMSFDILKRGSTVGPMGRASMAGMIQNYRPS